jgi:hypothetical protein
MKKLLERKIRKVLEKNKNIEFAYLFGSAARSEYFNDIDLAIFVKKMPRNTFFYEIKLANEIEKIIKLPVEVRIINNLPLFLLSMILRKGKLIFSRNERRRIAFETFKLAECLDFMRMVKEYEKTREKILIG